MKKLKKILQIMIFSLCLVFITDNAKAFAVGEEYTMYRPTFNSACYHDSFGKNDTCGGPRYVGLKYSPTSVNKWAYTSTSSFKYICLNGGDSNTNNCSNDQKVQVWCKDATGNEPDKITVKEVIDFSDDNPKNALYYGLYYMLSQVNNDPTNNSAVLELKTESGKTIKLDRYEQVLLTEIVTRGYTYVLLDQSQNNCRNYGENDYVDPGGWKASASANMMINILAKKNLSDYFYNNSTTLKSLSKSKNDNFEENLKNIMSKLMECGAGYNGGHYYSNASYETYSFNNYEVSGGTSADEGLTGTITYGQAKDLVSAAKRLLSDAIDKVEDYVSGKIGQKAKITSSYAKENETVENNRFTQIWKVRFDLTELMEKADRGAEFKINSNDITCEGCSSAGVTNAKKEYFDVNSNSWKNFQGEVDFVKILSKNNANLQLRLTYTGIENDGDNCDNVTVKVKYKVVDPDFKYQMAWGKGHSTQYGGTTERTSQQYWFLSPEEDSILSFNISTCKPCETNLTTPICSEETEGIAKVEAPEDIKKCVINKNDDAYNTYRLSDNNGGVNNDYCGTFCKEDYREISLNRALSNVNCGGYFKLKARIEGSKDCYRGSENTKDKSIDIDKYIEDIIDVQESLIKANDLYNKAKTAGGMSIKSRKSSECAKPTTYTDEKGVVHDGCAEYKTEYYVTGSYAGKEASTNAKTGEVTARSVTHNFSYSSTESSSAVSSAISADLSTAQSNLTSGNTRYENIIKQFNSCTKDWESKYNFDPKVYWEYSQNIDEVMDTSYNDLLSKEDRTLEPIESTRKDSDSLQACIGTTDEKIENCSTGWTSTSSVFVDRTYTKCNESGCSTDAQKVSQAKFIKQHFEVEQDYDTPTVYYQVTTSGPLSGSITTDKNFNIPNIPLTPVNGLPLSGDTTGGGIFKLKIEDLGEFYETGEQGRLIDFEGDHESSSVAYAKGYSTGDNWSGEYVCHYYTNCRPKECPNCTYTCEGEYCSWQECPDCTFECINCIYNLGDLQLNMKPVSTTNFTTSAGREYGYNWNISEHLSILHPELGMIQDKADETIKEIEENNTTIYDDTNTESADSKLEFRIEMTPDITGKIREYNSKKADEIDGEGGYNDASLVCYDYEDQNGNVQKNVFCYSTFIDMVIEKWGSNVYYKPSRGTAADRTNESVVNSGYWTPWSEYGKYGESVIGGPSWK